MENNTEINIAELIDQLKANLVDMKKHNIYINKGAEREVKSKLWEKDGKKRTYLSIQCYSLMGHFKGEYKCGYVDMISGEYVVTKYDDIDALNKEYLI